MGRGLYALVSLAFFIQVQSVDVSRENLQKTSFEKLIDNMTQEGDVKGIYADYQVKALLGGVIEHYPELVEFSGAIGQTSLGKSISIIGLHLPKDKRQGANTEWEKVDKSVESVLFVSYLLSVDYVSINTAMGLLLQVLHGYANQKPDIVTLLQHKTIWIVPILNVDALDFLLDFYKNRNSITFIYKNRKEDNYTNEDKCGRNGLGVNLNKNFPVGFNYDSDITSEGYPCSTNYGGVAPFSESETKGLDEVIKKIKPDLFVSLFTAAKMITFPNLEMLDKKDPTIESYKKYILTLTLYNEFREGVTLYDPLKHEKSSLYSKGGNLDEYLLYQKNIFPLNYYIGQGSTEANSFLPRKEILSKVVVDNAYNLQALACGTGSYIIIHNMQETYCKNQETCFSHLSGTIENYYYGIKLRFMDLGTKPIAPNAKVCLKIPNSRNYYIDKVFDKTKKPVELIMEGKGKEDQTDGSTRIQCFQLGQIDRYSYKYFYLILRRSGSSSSENRGASEQQDTDLQVYFKGYQECNSMSLNLSFDFQFYLYQETSLMSKLVIATLMGIILLVLCVKFFCCRKSHSTSYESTEQSQDTDDTDKAELTRIHSSSNLAKKKEQGEFSPVRQKAEVELSRAEDEDEDEQ